MKEYAEINVRGRVEPAWSDYFSGLEIKTTEADGASITKLSGDLIDQAALLGVLNGLYGLGYALLSVAVSTETQSQHDRQL